MMISVKENIPLQMFTTLGIGGRAKYFTEVKSVEDALQALNFAKEESLPVFIFGGGSNVLISDEGFDGLAILNKIDGISLEDNGERALIRVGAGEVWDRFVEYAVSRGLGGVECLSGIPGSVGAAPVQNIGAYGAEVSSVLKEVVAIDLETNAVKYINKDECSFGYRTSIFNTTQKGRYFILEVVFDLRKGGTPELKYQDIQNYFTGKPTPTLAEVRKAVLEIRARKGMVIHPDFESFKSAGSFFKNPIVSKEIFDNVFNKIGSSEVGWYWPQTDGMVKVSAAKLIELSGFSKGFKMGEAGISPKHALSLINLGNAKAEDIVRLAKDIMNKVWEDFRVRVQPEVLLIGFKDNPFLFQ